MKQYENILVTVSEECAEIQQAVSKALRFGLENHHPNTPEITNADDIIHEFYQLYALIDHLQGYGFLPTLTDEDIKNILSDKIKQVAIWQKVSYDAGILKGR